MTEEELAYFAAENLHSENEAVRKEAEKAWNQVVERGRELEREAMRHAALVPEGAKSTLEMYNEIMERLRKEEGPENPGTYRTS